MEQITLLMGQKGLIGVIGLMAFLLTYKYSVNLFSWFEDQTYGTRDYLMKQFEFLHFQTPEQKVVYALLAISFGPFFFFIILFSFLGHFFLGLIVGLIFLSLDGKFLGLS